MAPFKTLVDSGLERSRRSPCQHKKPVESNLIGQTRLPSSWKGRGSRDLWAWLHHASVWCCPWQLLVIEEGKREAELLSFSSGLQSNCTQNTWNVLVWGSFLFGDAKLLFISLRLSLTFGWLWPVLSWSWRATSLATRLVALERGKNQKNKIICIIV